MKIGTIKMADEKKKDSLSYSLIPTGALGENILDAARESLKKKMNDQIIGQVETIGNRAAQIQTNIEQMRKQHEHLTSQMDAIRENQFRIVNARIVFNDDALNADAAVRYPYQSH